MSHSATSPAASGTALHARAPELDDASEELDPVKLEEEDAAEELLLASAEEDVPAEELLPSSVVEDVSAEELLGALEEVPAAELGPAVEEVGAPEVDEPAAEELESGAEVLVSAADAEELDPAEELVSWDVEDRPTPDVLELWGRTVPASPSRTPLLHSPSRQTWPSGQSGSPLQGCTQVPLRW